jgi:O-antigen ligase
LEKKHYFFIAYFIFFFGFFVIPSTHWHNNLFYGLILFPYLVTFQLKRVQIIWQSNIWILSMILAGYMCLTLLWAENAHFKDYVYYLRRAVYLFVFLSLTIELVLRYPKFIDYFFTILCWVAAITAIASIVWYFSYFSFPESRLKYLADQVRNQVIGASVYGMISIICYFHVMKTKKSYTWIYSGLCIAILISVILTQSRGPLGALLITFLIGSVFTRDKKLFATVLCIILVGGLMFLSIDEIRELITRRGLSCRLEIWQQSLPRIKGAPLFGEGISANSTFILKNGLKMNHPHSVYLGTTLYGGLMGLFLLIIIQALALWESFLSFSRENDFTYMALLLFVFICIASMGYRVIGHPDELWMCFWLPIALLAGKRLSGEKTAISFSNNVD